MHSPRIQDSPLTEEDLCQMVRLLANIISLAQNIQEKRRFLMDELCGMIRANSWVWCMAECAADKPLSLIGFEHGGGEVDRFARSCDATNQSDGVASNRSSLPAMKEIETHLSRNQLSLDPCFLVENSPTAPCWAKANIGPLMTLQRPIKGQGISGICIYRELGEPHFDAREAKIAHIILSEIPWLHFTAFPNQAYQENAPLYPRHRTILNLLREGWSRKKISEHLGISENTVHGYAKKIFTHFGVHSQSELLASIAKGDGNDR